MSVINRCARSLLVIGLFLLPACQPAESVRAVDSRPILEIKGAPSDAVVIIDGLDMGSANKALRLEPGTHLVLVKQAGGTIYQDKVFLSGAMVRTINLER